MVKKQIRPNKYVPISLEDFDTMVRSWNYCIQTSTKHHKIIDLNGETLITFAVAHRKGQGQLVLPIYQRQFIKAVTEVESQYVKQRSN